YRAPYRTGNTYIVVQSAEPARHRVIDQRHVRLHTGAGTDSCVIEKLDVVHLAADDQAAIAAVSNEDVGPEPQQEVRHTRSPCGSDSLRELVRGACPVQQVRRAAYAKRRVRCERDFPLDTRGIQ